MFVIVIASLPPITARDCEYLAAQQSGTDHSHFSRISERVSLFQPRRIVRVPLRSRPSTFTSSPTFIFPAKISPFIRTKCSCPRASRKRISRTGTSACGERNLLLKKNPKNCVAKLERQPGRLPTQRGKMADNINDTSTNPSTIPMMIGPMTSTATMKRESLNRTTPQLKSGRAR